MKDKNIENNEQKKSWGGSREGAGRPPTGRKPRKYFLTDEEHALVKKYIDSLRES